MENTGESATSKLNPIQQRIADGMKPIAAYLTEHTCGEACWEAREDICRCACGGRNHGCMRSADGVQPARKGRGDLAMDIAEAKGKRVHWEPPTPAPETVDIGAGI